jgi:hypothetical protein
VNEPPVRQGKRNYGGEAAGYWMQVQSAYDHVILSTCYEGDFNLRHGRIKISHRFNQQGRIDFVELKFLRSLEPCLNGEIRKLLTVKEFQLIRKDWQTAEAFVLPVLPRELIFLYEDLFHCPKGELFAWLVNIGHRLVEDLLKDFKLRPMNDDQPRSRENSDQLCLRAVLKDEVAAPILAQASVMQAAVELREPKSAVVRYAS